MKRRDCPDCRTRLQPFWVPARRLGSEVELDRCHTCGGVWFDAGELSDASGKTVSPSQVKSSRSCPACGASMQQARLADGPEVEWCPSCRGTFLEAADLESLAKKVSFSRVAPAGTGFICDACGVRRPFIGGQATLTGFECASCQVEGPSAGPALTSAFGKFLGWLRGD